VDCSSDASVAKLRENRLGFLLQFDHRSVMLAARSEHERCMFVFDVFLVLFLFSW
jgi:hypothetical protein